MTIASTAPVPRRPPGVDVGAHLRPAALLVVQVELDRAAAARRRATRVSIPAASSTRAVALLMLGAIEGCTQPASISTLRACSRVGQAARVPPGRHLVFQRLWQQAAQRLAQLHRRGEQRRGQAFLQRPAQRLERRAARHFPSTILRPMSTRWPYSTPLGQVLSQLRQVRHRSRCSWVLRVGSSPSSTCLIR